MKSVNVRKFQFNVILQLKIAKGLVGHPFKWSDKTKGEEKERKGNSNLPAFYELKQACGNVRKLKLGSLRKREFKKMRLLLQQKRHYRIVLRGRLSVL